MADLSDVRSAFAGVIAGAIYPLGTANPALITAPCRIMQGWPAPGQVDTDMAAGNVLVSIYPQPGMERVTNRYPRRWTTLVPPAPTVTMTVDATGGHVTLSGTITTINGHLTTPQTLHILTRGIDYAYAVQANDTLASAASALATLISADTPATSSGAVITVPSGAETKANVSAQGTGIMEIGRQQRSFQITVWAPSEALRAATCKIIDPALRLLEFMALADGSNAWVLYRGSNDSDEAERMTIYRRDLFFWAEYPTTVTETEYSIADIQTNLKGSQVDPSLAPAKQTNFGG